jgi:uncharacterized protein (TIGR02246 family)
MTNMNEDERAIREVIATWLHASAEGDTKTVLDLMADDVVFLVAGRAPFGKEEFAKSQQGLSDYRVEGTSLVREIRVVGDWAWCLADLKVVITPKNDGTPIRRSGNTLSIFQRLSAGRWVLARDANLLTPEQ